MHKALIGIGIGICLLHGTGAKAAGVEKAKLEEVVPVTWTLPEIREDGKAATLDVGKLKAGKHLVLFFFSEQCGVTYYYKERIQKLQQEFESKGFVFLGVRCGKREKPNEPLEIAETKYLKMPFADDAAGDVAQVFNVRQSVTFAVIDRAGKYRYRGGFDDNVDSKHVKKTYLRDALREIAANKPVTVREGRALGCAILSVK